jgi:dihydroorotate dehydrogenase (fumarate)
VEAVRRAVDVPLAVKVGPYFSAMAHMARRLVDAGADGLVLFNRFYQPDIDLERLEVKPDLMLSSPEELRLVLRWIAILHGNVGCSLAATTGVHHGADAIKLILAGADVTMMASALLQHGPARLTQVRDHLADWLGANGYESGRQARGSLSQKGVADPAAFARSNYMRTLVGYSADWKAAHQA